MKLITEISKLLLIIGGLNWGLAIVEINLVNLIFGFNAMAENLVYLLIAASSVIAFIDCWKNSCKK